MSRLSLTQLTILYLCCASPSLIAENLTEQNQRLDLGIDWGYGCTSAEPVDSGTRKILAPIIPQGRPGFIYLEADNAELDQQQDELRLNGDSALRKSDTYLEADQIIYHRQPGNAVLHDDIYLEQPGIRLTADQGQFELASDHGWLSNVEFRLPEHKARGNAQRAEMLSKSKSRYTDASFTTCPPGYSDWSIGASELEIDQETGWGDAYHAVLRLGSLPVLYSPYFTFPVDDRRKSGLLLPSWGSSRDLGTEFSIPYYLNLAPDYDATITPRWMSRRGLMLGGEVRFLTEHQRGALSGELLNDKVESDEHDSRRSAFKLHHTSQPFKGLNTRIDYTEVSDKEYLDDFSTGLETSSTRHLERIAEVNYLTGDWRLNGRLQDFQTVDKSLATISYPYSLLPRLSLGYNKLFERFNSDVKIDSEYTYFEHDTKPTGQRLRLMPSAGLKLSRPWGYLAPRLTLNHVAYQLDETDTEQSPSFTAPTLSLDSGLVFERDSSWFGNAATQTLEPRLYYLYAPFEDQIDAPDFDTADLELSFANLFKDNRFSGGDRVGDANQLALGITSRWLENDTGLERLRASIGQIFYYWDREVQLTGDTQEQSSSAIVAELSSRLSTNWRSSLNLRWDPQQDEKQIDKGRIGIHYRSPEQQLFNVSYNYSDQGNDKTKIEDIDLSFYWQFGHSYTLLGDWKHSLFHKRDLNRVVGLGYSGRCCWSLTAVYQQYINETDLDENIDQEADTRFMLQLELRGLGFLGRDIRQTLKDSIYGYRPEQ
ncbi:MAG: LPS-assembly protein LptD [Pseudomonadota bacterium]